MEEQREKISREITVSPWGPGFRRVTFRVEGWTGSGILGLYMVDEPPPDISMCLIQGSVQVSKSVELATKDDDDTRYPIIGLIQDRTSTTFTFPQIVATGNDDSIDTVVRKTCRYFARHVFFNQEYYVKKIDEWLTQ